MNNKHTHNLGPTVSHERREFLKAGIAIAAAPVMGAMAFSGLPSEARAQGQSSPGKSILIISASPRAYSNSDALCDEFMRGAQKAGHQVEKIRLAEKNINYCTGCLACIHEPGACIQQDDMDEIHKKMLAADVMVLATPVYFHVMNGQMKVFVDRVCPIYTMIRNTDVYFIVSAAGGSLPVESTVQSFRVFTGCLPGIREKGTISITGVWDEGGVKGTKAMKQAYEAGLNA